MVQETSKWEEKTSLCTKYVTLLSDLEALRKTEPNFKVNTATELRPLSLPSRTAHVTLHISRATVRSSSSRHTIKFKSGS